MDFNIDVEREVIRNIAADYHRRAFIERDVCKNIVYKSGRCESNSCGFEECRPGRRKKEWRFKNSLID